MSQVPIATALDVWRQMRRDPAMLEGLTIGGVMDLFAGITAILELRVELLRCVPVPLMNALRGPGWSEALAAVQEMVKLPMIRAELDRLLDLREQAGL